jgi:hypothetical protein
MTSNTSLKSSNHSQHSQDSVDLDELPIVEVQEDEKSKEEAKTEDLPGPAGISLARLPDEIILKICRFLDAASFGKLSMTSKRFVPVYVDVTLTL